MGALDFTFDLPAHFLDLPGQRAGFVLLASFLITFLFIRTSARLMRSPKVPWWPGSVKTESGLHLHHLVFGIVLMLVGGTLGFALDESQSPWIEIAAAAFGIGAGLTFDEFALWVHLEDVYWSDEGRQSVDEFMLGARRSGPDKRVVDLRAGELVRAIEIPVPAADFSAAYTRLVRRKGTDLASITLGVSVDGDGVTQVAYGSVGPRAFLTRDESGVLADATAAQNTSSAFASFQTLRRTKAKNSCRCCSSNVMNAWSSIGTLAAIDAQVYSQRGLGCVKKNCISAGPP